MKTNPTHLQDLLLKIENLFKKKKYAEIIALLPDEISEKYQSAILFAWRARAFQWIKDYTQSMIYVERALSLDNKLPMAYFVRANVWRDKKEYDYAIVDYDKAIALDSNYSSAYNNRGLISYVAKEYDKALIDFEKAISIDQNVPDFFNNRGLIWYDKKDYEKALADYNKAILLDPNYDDAYCNIGNLWYEKGEYNKAIAEYNKAINLDSNQSNFYNSRGIAFTGLNQDGKAMDDYNKAIELSPDNSTPYYNRALVYHRTQEYEKAISDYKQYILLENDMDDPYTKRAEAAIKDLEKNLEDKNKWRPDVEKVLSDIKDLLLFKKSCVTHYTTLSGAKEMVLKNSPFRLSEGAFLNDTSEGKELLKYLDFSVVEQKGNDTRTEDFLQKPFIGSFVEEYKFNDLTLWRMYGKEAQAEGKGCALTVDRESFLENFKAAVYNGSSLGPSPSTDKSYQFYKIAYIQNEDIFIPTEDKLDQENNIADNTSLKNLLQLLKEKISALEQEQKLDAMELINKIRYLFKSADYRHENEVRLIVDDPGIKKNVGTKNDIEGSMLWPPRVYIEMTDIVPTLKKITLGPKVERADEWAAAFYYHIKEVNKKDDVEIVISHLSFK